MVVNFEVELPNQGDNIIRTKEYEVTPNPKGLAHELYIRLREGGDALAQQDAETEETDTYKTYTERIVRVALHLRRRGVTTEDVVTPCTTTHMNSGVVFVATILSGAKVACVDPFIAYVDGKAQIDMVKPKIIFVSPESVERVEKIVEELHLKTEIVVFGQTETHTHFSEFLKPLPDEEEENFEPYIPKDLFETAIIVFSSGSTGIPKGICVNHYSIICQTLRMIDSNNLFSLNGLSYSPLAWASAQVSIISSIMCLRCNLLCRDFEIEKTWRYLVKYDIGILRISPHNSIGMLKHGNPNKIQTPHLKMVCPMGGKIADESADALSKIFSPPARILIVYGQTEVYGVVLAFKSEYMKKPGYVGNPVAGFTYKIVDPETGKICGPNERGELYLKSKYAMNGYYNHDSSDRFDEDGFLKTGDIFYYDRDHSFFFVERCREALRYKGYWLAPSYLESILYQHPAVKIACVIGIESDDGDIPTGIVVKEDDAQDVTEDELLKYVNDQVTELKKIRGGVIFVDESLVEFTPSGKVRRYFLRKKVLEMLQKARS